MKQFLSFVRKEFYHILRDRYTVMILFLIPIIQILLFGFAVTNEVKNTKMAVFDPSKDISTERIIRRLDANEYFSLVEYLRSPDDIERVFREGRASLVVIFSENFHDNLLHTGEGNIRLVADATDPNQARAFAGYASGIIADYAQEMMRNVKIPLQIVPEVRMLYNPQAKGAYNFVPGIMGAILMLTCAMMTSISIVREKERGTMEVLLASPVKPIFIIFSKIMPYLTLAIVDLGIILLMSLFVLDVPVAGNFVLLISIALLFMLSAMCIGLFISNIANTQVTAMLISGIGLMMPTILLSGLIFPIECMPGILQWLSCILPVKWFIQAIRKVMIQGVDAVYVAKEIAVLTGMIVFLLFISLKTFVIRLKK
jgi:ABC-2 type transport system permease protein